MPPQVIREYCTIEEGESLDKIKKFLYENDSNRQTPKTLGLHWHGKKARAGNYIGIVWIGKGDSRFALRVDSKFENPTMDYMKMFSDCCTHPIVGKKMQGCFDVWPEQESIEIKNDNNFSFMVVVAFLHELNTLCIRHLRRHFHRKQENFVGKVKGKILISENIRRNFGHAERMFCEYQSISDNILENRILRTALEKAARYLSAFQKESEGYPALQRWVHSCRSHLGGVSPMHITKRDISKARNRGAFTPYRRPLHLAKAVLHRFGFNPHAEQKDTERTGMPPYCINSAKLFELYAELQLLKEFPNIKPQGRMENKKDGFQVYVRPDFYVSRQGEQPPRIIDAKYKDVRTKFKDGRMNSNSDLYQMVAYSQHLDVLERINKGDDNLESTEGLELYLAYPWLKNMSWPSDEFTDAFKTRIRIRKIECPVVESSTDNSEN